MSNNNKTNLYIYCVFLFTDSFSNALYRTLLFEKEKSTLINVYMVTVVVCVFLRACLVFPLILLCTCDVKVGFAKWSRVSQHNRSPKLMWHDMQARLVSICIFTMLTQNVSHNNHDSSSPLRSVSPESFFFSLRLSNWIIMYCFYIAWCYWKLSHHHL